MKRSEINTLVRAAGSCFQTHGWILPPNPRWDVTDFGLGDWQRYGLVLINLAEEPEYCEKLMYAQMGMTTPAHCHRRKKEDIISRWGTLGVRVWSGKPDGSTKSLEISVNGRRERVESGTLVELPSGWRITVLPETYHEFAPLSDECILGEVSTANDDLHDNIFVNPDVGRFPQVHEDESPIVQLLSDHQTLQQHSRGAIPPRNPPKTK